MNDQIKFTKEERLMLISALAVWETDANLRDKARQAANCYLPEHREEHAQRRGKVEAVHRKLMSMEVV